MQVQIPVPCGVALEAPDYCQAGPGGPQQEKV